MTLAAATFTISPRDVSLVSGDYLAANLLKRLSLLLQDCNEVPYKMTDALVELLLSEAKFRTAIKKLTSLGFIQGVARKIAKPGDYRAVQHFTLNLQKITDLGWEIAPVSAMLPVEETPAPRKYSAAVQAMMDEDEDTIEWAVADDDEPVETSVAALATPSEPEDNFSFNMRMKNRAWLEDHTQLPWQDKEKLLIEKEGRNRMQAILDNGFVKLDFEAAKLFDDREIVYVVNRTTGVTQESPNTSVTSVTQIMARYWGNMREATRIYDCLYTILPGLSGREGGENWVSCDTVNPGEWKPLAGNVIIRDFDDKVGVNEAHIIFDS